MEGEIRYYCQSAEYLPSFMAPSNNAGFYTSIDYWDPAAETFVQRLKTLPGNFKDKLSPADFGLEVSYRRKHRKRSQNVFYGHLYVLYFV